MNVKAYLDEITETRKVDYDVVERAFKEGLAKAARKHQRIDSPNAMIRVEIDENGEVSVFQQYKVVEEAEDFDAEIDLEEARSIKEDVQLGDVIEEEIEFTDFGRTTVAIVKSVLNQQIKEATKKMVYNEYIDKVDDLVMGKVQSVEDKFVLIDLGKTLALLPKSEQIPHEKYYEGQQLKVVIKDVSLDPKSAQVVVSRASGSFVKRLFETSVTEIYQGIVEIKAIAREANERTKVAVYSNNPNVDAVGACIGPRGQRIAGVISEINQSNNPLSHEYIDVIEWKPDFIDYVCEVLKPANVVAIIPTSEDRSLLIVVEDEKQSSQAIGRRGINARLASKLLDCKIDVKAAASVEEIPSDWRTQAMIFGARKEAIRKQKALEALKAKEEEEARLAQLNAAEEAAQETEAETEAVEEPVIAEPETVVSEPVVTETVEEPVTETVAEETPVETPTVEEPAEPAEEKPETTRRRKPDLEKLKASDYVSKYEELADAKKATKQTSTRRKKNTKEDEEAAELKKKLEALKAKDYAIKPEYSEEELEEFNYEDDHWYDDDDVDYEEYDDYYDED